MKNVINNILLTLTAVMATTVTAEDVVPSEMTLEKHAFLPYDPVYFQNRTTDNNADMMPLFNTQGKELSSHTTGNRYIPVSPKVLVIETKDKHYGLINRQGEVLVKPKYTEMIQYTPKLFGFDDTGIGLNWQLYDRKGQVFAPQCRYVKGAFRGQVAWCLSDKTNLLDLNTGKLLTQGDYNPYSSFNENGLMRIDGRVKSICQGLTVINTKGEYIIPCKGYSQVQLLDNGSIAFQLEYNQPWGLYYERKEVVKPQYDSIDYRVLLSLSAQASEQFTIYYVDKRQGILDKNGKEITPPKYEDIEETANPYVVALTLNGKTDYLDLKTLKWVAAVPPKNETAEDDMAEQIMQDVNAIAATIDNVGSEEIKSYNSAGVELQGFAKMQALDAYMEQYEATREEIKYYPELNIFTYFRDANHYGIINSKGRKLLLSQYQNSSLLTNNLFAIKKEVGHALLFNKGVKWGAVNIKNSTVIPFEYDNLLHLTNECFLAKQEGKWGIINDKNEVLLPPTFSTLDVVSDNAMKVTNEAGKIGFLDRKQCKKTDTKMNIEFPYSQTLAILDYQNTEYAVVKNNKGVGLFSLTALEEIIPTQYTDIAIKEEKLFVYDGENWTKWVVKDKL